MTININPPVIAHRGASQQAPENTLIAFRKAKADGAHWIEFDVMLSADDEVVVIHDETLERTTNGKGNVCDMSLDKLQTLDAGSWFSAEFAGEKIPTLRAVIELIEEHRLLANVEIKAQPGAEERTVTKVLQVLREYWKSPLWLLLISSFSQPILEEVRKQAPDASLGFLMHEWDADWQEKCDRLQCITVNVNCDILTIERVSAIKATERLLTAYTVNDPEIARELFSWGVDAIFSDDAAGMLATL